VVPGPARARDAPRIVRHELIETRAVLSGGEHFVSRLFRFMALGGVKLVVAFKALARGAFGENWPGHGSREPICGFVT